MNTKHNNDPYQLDDIQLWIQNALIYGGQKTFDKDIDNIILPSSQLSAKERLAIYQRSYYARLLQCMSEQFKALSHALGEQLFTDFARNYLMSIPSTSPTLSDLGASFSIFLNTTRPDKDAEKKESWIDFMVELARFEWDIYRLFDAKGIEGLNIKTDKLNMNKLGIQPCFSLHQYDFPVNEYYRSVSLKKEAIIPFEEKSFIAICRKDYQINVTRLFPVQYAFLQKLKKGNSVADALSNTAQEFNGPEIKLYKSWQTWFIEWRELGFFIPG